MDLGRLFGILAGEHAAEKCLLMVSFFFLGMVPSTAVKKHLWARGIRVEAG